MPSYRLFDNLEEANKKVPLNKAVRIRVGKESFCLARSAKGLHVFDDSCPHMGESLTKGHINYLSEITCPWHSYRYNMMSGEECEGRSKAINVYRIEVKKDGVYFTN